MASLLDAAWEVALAAVPWPKPLWPEVVPLTLAEIRERNAEAADANAADPDNGAGNRAAGRTDVDVALPERS